MRVDEGLIREIVQRILSVARPERIILFGSAALGTMSRDSDIDILVIKQEAKEPTKESLRLRRALGNLGYPFDIIVVSSQWFEETKNIVGGISYPAHKYGKVIYEAA